MGLYSHSTRNFNSGLFPGIKGGTAALKWPFDKPRHILVQTSPQNSERDFKQTKVLVNYLVFVPEDIVWLAAVVPLWPWSHRLIWGAVIGLFVGGGSQCQISHPDDKLNLNLPLQCKFFYHPLMTSTLFFTPPISHLNISWESIFDMEKHRLNEINEFRFGICQFWFFGHSK